MIDRINSYRMEFPGSLRPLTQLWRQQQMLQITLFDEKARYQHLQESSDSQIDSLRQNRARLQSQLQDTSRKLENLTDIERQLSSRKQLQGEILKQHRLAKGEAAGKNGAAAKGAEPQDEPERAPRCRLNRKTPIRRPLPIRSLTRNDRTQTGQPALG